MVKMEGGGESQLAQVVRLATILRHTLRGAQTEQFPLQDGTLVFLHVFEGTDVPAATHTAYPDSRQALLHRLGLTLQSRELHGDSLRCQGRSGGTAGQLGHWQQECLAIEVGQVRVATASDLLPPIRRVSTGFW